MNRDLENYRRETYFIDAKDVTPKKWYQKIGCGYIYVGGTFLVLLVLGLALLASQGKPCTVRYLDYMRQHSNEDALAVAEKMCPGSRLVEMSTGEFTPDDTTYLTECVIVHDGKESRHLGQANLKGDQLIVMIKELNFSSTSILIIDDDGRWATIALVDGHIKEFDPACYSINKGK